MPKPVIRFFKRFLMTLFVIYSVLCIAVYFLQEKLIFFPEKLDPNYAFQFDQPFEEIEVKTPDGTTLNLLHFEAESSRGAVLHFHGNAGSNRSWGNRAHEFTTMGYDFFIFDYRGFGKSEGSIYAEEQLIADAECIYATIEEQFSADQIIIEGFSIGTGMAVQIAARHPIHHLILLAPYQRLTQMMRSKFPILPTFLLKYPFNSKDCIKKISAPISIFHGKADEIIPYEHSIALSTSFHDKDQLILVDNVNHNDLPYSSTYLSFIKDL